MSIVDQISPSIHRSRIRKAFLVGVGSLIDLGGIATYRAMQDLMPAPTLTPLNAIYRKTNTDLSRSPSSSTNSRSLFSPR